MDLPEAPADELSNALGLDFSRESHYLPIELLARAIVESSQLCGDECLANGSIG